MNITNEPQQETALLTKEDLAIASYALAECFNSFLAAYAEEEYGDGTKEQMETSMSRLRTTFTKFDGLLGAINQEEEQEAQNEGED